MARSRHPGPGGASKAWIAFAAVAVLNVVWFSSFSGRSLMGDDLQLLLESRSGGYASSLVGALTQTAVDKYRPVLTVVLALLTDGLGADFSAYRRVNLSVQVLNVGLVGLLAWRLSSGSWLVTASAMVMVTVSRFNTYFVLQVFGLMEGMALAFLLGMLLSVHIAWQSRSRRPLAAALACYFLTVFTHERFIVVGGFLVVAILVMPVAFRSLLRRISVAAAAPAIALSNIAVKAWVLDTHYFTGVGGERVGFTPGETGTFMMRGLMNLLGFNTGPGYLSGRNMHSLGGLGLGLGLALTLPILILVLALAARDWPGIRQASWPLLRKYLLAASLFVPLLLSASITFRQEYRWLYAPFVVLVLGVSWMLGHVPRPGPVRALAALGVLAASVTVDGYYRRHVENTYFFSGLRTVDAVRARVLDSHPGELDTTTVFIITNGDPVVENFYLHGGDFFEVYAPPADADIRLVPSLEAARLAQTERPKVRAFEVRGDGVVDVTSALR